MGPILTGPCKHFFWVRVFDLRGTPRARGRAACRARWTVRARAGGTGAGRWSPHTTSRYLRDG